MDRGVVVGGLMICGSFLLAASLNRSAVKEAPPVAPAAAAAPTPPLRAVPVDQSKSAACASDANSSRNEPVVGEEPDPGDLPGNGRKACSQ